MRTSQMTAVALAVVLALVAGCGGDDGGGGGSPEEAVLEVVNESQRAVLDEDAETLCETFTVELRARLKAVSRVIGEGDEESCEAGAEAGFQAQTASEVERIERALNETTPEDVRVRGDRAVVTYPSGREQPLVLTRDGWLIAGESKPPNGQRDGN